jgi:hypothetical protein
MTLDSPEAKVEAGSRRLGVLLAMPMFVLVVDTSLMNLSIAAGPQRAQHSGVHETGGTPVRPDARTLGGRDAARTICTKRSPARDGRVLLAAPSLDAAPRTLRWTSCSRPMRRA